MKEGLPATGPEVQRLGKSEKFMLIQVGSCPLMRVGATIGSSDKETGGDNDEKRSALT